MTTFPSFGVASPLSSGTGTSRNPSLPTGLGTGQVVIGICCSKNNATHSWSSNFTKLLQVNSGASFTISVGYFFWTPSISAPSVSWTGSAASACQLFSYKDCDTITAGSMATGTTSPHTSTGLNTVNDASTVVYLDQCATNTALTTPSGYTSRISNADATSVTASNVGDKTVATKGTGSGNISTTGGAAAWGQVQIILSQSILPGQQGDGQSGQPRTPVRINDLMQMLQNITLLQPAPVAPPPGLPLPELPRPLPDIDQSQFVAPLQALLTSPPPNPFPAFNELTRTVVQPDRTLLVAPLQVLLTPPPPPPPPPFQIDWPLPRVPVQPERSQFISPLRALINSVFPGQPRDWPLPVRVQQPDRSLFASILPILLPLPPQTPPPSHQLQDLPIVGPQPNRHFFSQAWQTFIPCASFSHAYSNAYCGGISPPPLSPGLTALPIRVVEPDRTFLQAINPSFIPCASFSHAYSSAYCGGVSPSYISPPLASLPIVVQQPDRSFFVSANPAIIPPNNNLPVGTSFFDLPRVAPQPNRSFDRGTLPTLIPQNVPPPRHGLSELPRVAQQPDRTFLHWPVPISTIILNVPPPSHALSALPTVAPQFNRSLFNYPQLSFGFPPPFPVGGHLPQHVPPAHLLDYSAFSRYPVIIPAPPVPPPHKHHLWNPPNTPGGAQWTSPSDRGQLWTKVTSGNQSWQSKPIPNS